MVLKLDKINVFNIINNLYILTEIYTNGYEVNILSIISLVAIICGVFVIITKNPIISVLFLIGLFLSISSYLILLGINFVGISYILVYVGAVSILFIFILMLINIRISELLSETSNSIPLAILSTIIFNYLIYNILSYNIITFNNYNINLNNIFYDIIYNNNYYLKIIYKFNDSEIVSFVSSNAWDGSIGETIHITTIGNIMYTNYSI
jgi:NADH-ubiquinone oxidoreductase chain 6